MKKKKIEKSIPVPMGKYPITYQEVEGIAVLNIYVDKALKARYCMDSNSHEYAVLKESPSGDWIWHTIRINILLDSYSYSAWRYGYKSLNKDVLSDTDRKDIKKLLGEGVWCSEPFSIISSHELHYSTDKRWRYADNRRKRVDEYMSTTPELPDGIEEWIFKAAGMEERFIKSPIDGLYYCSACGNGIDREMLGKPNALSKCPECKAMGIKMLTRCGHYEEETNMSIIQNMGDGSAVMRHFDIMVRFADEKKEILMSEATRVVMPKDGRRTKYVGCDIYYNQIPKRGNTYYGEEFSEDTDFDNRGNGANRRMKPEYLYPEGIDNLKDTRMEKWIYFLQIASRLNMFIDYNSIISVLSQNLASICELLIKGRFYNLVKDVSKSCDVWYGKYSGSLNTKGESITEVLGLSKQAVNRIRDRNGNMQMLKYLQYAETSGNRFSDKALEWFCKNNVKITNYKGNLYTFAELFTPEAAMNYFERQRRESYPSWPISSIIEEYEDYMNMALAAGKDIFDEMVYRPRELKRRHDELVVNKQKLEIAKKMQESPEQRAKEAEAMRQRFPGAEENLAKVKDKYTWSDDKYIVIVPESLTEIMIEGNALHHCVGASDRYFDRIMNDETYICFLRTKEEPNLPFYTLEVEPGGTIRQHRGYMDEEPNIDEVKIHLKAWQKEVRSRMKKEDHKLEAISREKREANIAELTKARNTRVLKGLMEDFMEAI